VSVNRYFQHAHFLTERTVIDEPSDMMSLEFPSFIHVLKTFHSSFETKVSNIMKRRCSLILIVSCLNFVIIVDDKISDLLYSAGESVILLL
jgi:hypothetical protein